MAINNLAEQCYISTYGPMENMNMLTKMDMVKVKDVFLFFFTPCNCQICLGLICWLFDSRSIFWTRWRRRGGRGRSSSRAQQWRVGPFWQTGGRKDPREAARRNSKAQVKSAGRVRWRVEVTALFCLPTLTVLSSLSIYGTYINLTCSEVSLFWWWYAYNFNVAIHSTIPSVVVLRFS